ncbi:hypothetical protein [Priestia megaterium]|uniref:hypothetical protein n=1 Tax=Priestia megaterium TaxID=1404 RepID=UPI000BFB4328|nr:hypothetical protein [Priestia megaterium]PGQ88369.1 hypothetical protein COA18_05410 [Priestia megaterium]
MSDNRRFILQIIFVFVVIFGFVALTFVNNLHQERMRHINTTYDLKTREHELKVSEFERNSKGGENSE